MSGTGQFAVFNIKANCRPIEFLTKVMSKKFVGCQIMTDIIGITITESVILVKYYEKMFRLNS